MIDAAISNQTKNSIAVLVDTLLAACDASLFYYLHEFSIRILATRKVIALAPVSSKDGPSKRIPWTDSPHSHCAVDQVATESGQNVHSADTGEYERQTHSSTSTHEIADFPFRPLLLSSPSSLAPHR